MKLLTLTLMIATTILLGTACSRTDDAGSNQSQPKLAASPAAKVTPDEFAVARANFAKDCTECHGADGAGGSKTIDGKTLRVPTMKEGHALKHPDEDFISQITKGGDGMPAFKDKLSPQEMSDLVRFIRKEFQGK